VPPPINALSRFPSAYLLAAALVGIFLIWVIFARDLPSADTLIDYEPDLPTMVRGVDGEIINSYARERRGCSCSTRIIRCP
jgi:penicillin-binding protein 1A